MTTLEQLHDRRTQIAEAHQPSYVKELDSIRMFLKSNALQHPYQLSLSHFLQLRLLSWYLTGPLGIKVDSAPQSVLFRIGTIRHLAKNTTGWNGLVSHMANPRDLFEALNHDYLRKTDWLPLKNYANGYLKGPRNITWWTSHSIEQHNLIAGANQLGMPSDWLYEYMVLLRARSTNLAPGTLRVPTVLDAFESYVFHATKDKDSPVAGISIHISRSLPPIRGVPEYVLGPIDVGTIDFIPVHLTNAVIESEGTPSGPQLFAHLAGYYSDLQREP